MKNEERNAHRFLFVPSFLTIYTFSTVIAKENLQVKYRVSVRGIQADVDPNDLQDLSIHATFAYRAENQELCTLALLLEI